VVTAICLLHLRSHRSASCREYNRKLSSPGNAVKNRRYLTKVNPLDSGADAISVAAIETLGVSVADVRLELARIIERIHFGQVSADFHRIQGKKSYGCILGKDALPMTAQMKQTNGPSPPCEPCLVIVRASHTAASSDLGLPREFGLRIPMCPRQSRERPGISCPRRRALR